MTYLIATFGPSEQRVPLAYLALCCLPLGNGPLSLCWKLGLASLGRVLGHVSSAAQPVSG